MTESTGKSTGPKVHIEVNGKSLPWDDAKATPLKDIQQAVDAFKNMHKLSADTTISVNKMTEVLSETDPLESIRGDITLLDEDLSVLRSEVEQAEIFNKMTQRVAIAALLVQCGAKPKDLSEITRIWMFDMGGRNIDEIAMEELYVAADEAVTQFYAGKQS